VIRHSPPEGFVPQLAFANSFWESFDALEKPVKAGVRKAMKRFQQLAIAELYADKGLHLESVVNARDPRMRMRLPLSRICNPQMPA
jgi:hypothetical protein